MSTGPSGDAVDVVPGGLAGAMDAAGAGAAPFVPVVVGREVQRVTFPSPTGPLEGYQLRFQLESLQPDGSSRSTWTEWLHLPNPLMLYLTESLDTFMRTEGHLVAWPEARRRCPAESRAPACLDSLNALTGGTPVASLLLITILVASLIGLFVEPGLIDKNLLRPYWLVPRAEYPTLVTSGFIHADLSHLFFNGFTFWAFAFTLEKRIGSGTFFALYLFGLLVSSGGTWWKHKTEPDYRSLGASGAILAVLFASIIYFPTQSLYIMFIPVPIPAPVFAVAYLGYTWYASRQARGRINHDAHLTGAIAGVLFVALTDGAAFGRGVHSMFG